MDAQHGYTQWNKHRGLPVESTYDQKPQEKSVKGQGDQKGGQRSTSQTWSTPDNHTKRGENQRDQDCAFKDSCVSENDPQLQQNHQGGY